MARISTDRSLPKPQDYASDGTDAVGFIQFWGNSPALDLLNDPQAASFGPLAIGTSPSGVYHADKIEESKKEKGGYKDGEEASEGEDESEDEGLVVEEQKEADPNPAPFPSEEDEPINILIAGGADVRHVLKTMAKRRASVPAGQRLRFYLHESRHEVLARHLLFLQVMNNTGIPCRERMELLLSLYGNTLVREKDSTYVEEIAKEFIEMITDNSSHPLAEVVDLSHLKYRDRDILQDVFKGWLKDVEFDVEALREQRCRGYYRERYDYRKNLMDYDYQNHIKQKAGIINWFHYKEFCHTGVAFETRLASYSTPNRTLASYTEATDRSKGTTVQVRGFWGDIINSPYHAFSTTTDPEDRPRLFKISGSQYRHTETDVAEFNVTAFLSEMETGEQYHLPPETPGEHAFPYSSPLEELRTENKVEEVIESTTNGDSTETSTSRGARRGQKKKQSNWPALSPGFGNVEVIFLSGPISEVLKKPKYNGRFHRAFIGSMGILPLFEEMELVKSDGDIPFRAKGNSKVRKPPRVEAPEMFAKMKDQSAFANVMAPGALVICETLKYQAHFDGIARLAFRHRLAQAGHLAGWRLLDEGHAVPRLEEGMKERRANDLEKNGTDFIRFVTGSTAS